MRLRGYQRNGIQQISRLFENGGRRVLVVAPTGAGKGAMAAHLVLTAVEAKQRVLFLAHRREIVVDMSARLHALGAIGTEVETVQSLRVAKKLRFDLVVVDEAHHYRAEEWRAVLERAGKNARVLGFTATPQRGDGRALGDVFQELVDVVSYSALLKARHIVPCRVLTSPYPLASSLALPSDIAYQRYANGSTALVFERDAKAARTALERFRTAGINAELVLASTRSDERDEALKRIGTGALKVLINVFVLTEGVDLPRVDTIILARTCEHVGTYMQIVGRALRAWPGKTSALLIDLSGASHVHGEPTTDRAYSLRSSDGPINEASLRPRAVVEGNYAQRADVVFENLELVEFSRELREQTTREIPSRAARVMHTLDWSKTSIGRKPDQEVANELGLHLRTIIRARQRFAIPAYNSPTVDWDVESRLGKMLDTDLAKALGLDVHAVTHARRRRNIPRFRPNTAAAIANDPDLGRLPDRILAARYEVGGTTVHTIRTRLGIAAAERPTRDWQWDKQPLGKIRDKELAARLACSAALVRQARVARGIPPAGACGRPSGDTDCE
jgi:superfamily II DNA or RNA helicase